MATRQPSASLLWRTAHSAALGLGVALIVGAGCDRLGGSADAQSEPAAEEETTDRAGAPAPSPGAPAAPEAPADLAGASGGGDDPIPALSASLEDLIRDARKGGRVGRLLRVTEADRTQFAGGIAVIARAAGTPQRGDVLERALSDLARLGFAVGTLATDHGRALCVREALGVRRGGGFYVLTAAPSRLVVQAPHSFFDTGTGDLARELFVRGRAHALFVNTVHRYEGAKPSPGHHADVCHREDTLFHSGTVALARVASKLAFVQLHGFSSAKHPELGAFQCVVSAGRRAEAADPPLENCVRLLRAALGADKVAVYGRDVSVLGGTTNVQGRLLNAYSDDVFYHVELASELRRRLRGDDALRQRVLDAIAELGAATR